MKILTHKDISGKEIAYFPALTTHCIRVSNSHNRVNVSTIIRKQLEAVGNDYCYQVVLVHEECPRENTDFVRAELMEKLLKKTSNIFYMFEKISDWKLDELQISEKDRLQLIKHIK